MIPTDKQYRNITKDKHTALRLIREEAIMKFFKRFSGQKLSGSHRNQTRQVERWLDKNHVNIAFTKDKMSFAVYIPNRVTVLRVIVEEDLENMRYEYLYSIEEKDDLIPEYGFTEWPEE